MGLFSKLKKLHKKIDPIGSKIHAKTGGKLEAKVQGKTPLSKMVHGTKRASKENLQKTTAAPTATAPKVTGGASKPRSAGKQLGSFNNLAISRRRVK